MSTRGDQLVADCYGYEIVPTTSWAVGDRSAWCGEAPYLHSIKCDAYGFRSPGVVIAESHIGSVCAAAIALDVEWYGSLLAGLHGECAIADRFPATHDGVDIRYRRIRTVGRSGTTTWAITSVARAESTHILTLNAKHLRWGSKRRQAG